MPIEESAVNYFAHCPSCRQNWLQPAQSWGAGMACPVCGLPVAPGAILGRFQLVREVSAGGLGSVHEAIDANTGRLVAIKTLRQEVFTGAAAVARFGQEAQIAASLSHPNIAEVYEFGHDGGTYFLAMELLESGSLAERIRSGPLPERDVLRVGLDVARGLQAASAKGLLHRDVKPGNVVFDVHGRAKLVDFGLAMPVEEVKRGEGGAWGSPYYVPPERLEGAPEDFRSDIYSLGASLFHAAAGRPPFKATSASVAAWKHLKAQRVSVKAFAPHLSEETCSVINRCIERRPEDRYGDYFQLIEALESAFKHAMLSPETANAPSAEILAPGERSDFGLRWVAVGAALIVVMAAGVFFALSRRGHGVLEESGGVAAVSQATEDVSLRAPEPGSDEGMVRFSAEEGYSSGEIDAHPHWLTDKHPSWEVPMGGGSVHFPAKQGAECRAFFTRAATLPPESALRGSLRFSHGGLGTAPSDKPWRILLSVKVVDRQKSGNRGFEINWVKMASSLGEYEAHMKVLEGASETGQMQVLGHIRVPNADVGDDADAPGDPTDLMELGYVIRKGHSEATWSMEVTLTNVTKGRVVGTFAKDNIVTAAEIFESVKFFGSFGGQSLDQPREVSGWSFAGLGAPVPVGEAGVDFGAAQGYGGGDLGSHPHWLTERSGSWVVSDGGGSVRYIHPGEGSPAAVYQPMVRAAQGDVIRGSVRFEFDGMGRTVDPNYRDILKLCVCPSPAKPGSGIEMVFHRSKDAEEDYTWHIRTTKDVSGTGDLGTIAGNKFSSADAGDVGEAPGDPSDTLQLDFEIRKGPGEAYWSFKAKMVNVTTGKELLRMEKEIFPTVPEFYASPGYFLSLRGAGRTPRLDIKAVRFGVGGP